MPYDPFFEVYFYIVYSFLLTSFIMKCVYALEKKQSKKERSKIKLPFRKQVRNAVRSVGAYLFQLSDSIDPNDRVNTDLVPSKEPESEESKEKKHNSSEEYLDTLLLPEGKKKRSTTQGLPGKNPRPPNEPRPPAIMPRIQSENPKPAPAKTGVIRPPDEN